MVWEGREADKAAASDTLGCVYRQRHTGWGCVCTHKGMDTHVLAHTGVCGTHPNTCTGEFTRIHKPVEPKHSHKYTHTTEAHTDGCTYGYTHTCTHIHIHAHIHLALHTNTCAQVPKQLSLLFMGLGWRGQTLLHSPGIQGAEGLPLFFLFWGGQQSWRACMNSNPASLAGGSWSPLSLPLSLLPVSPSLVQRRFPGWARRWGRPLHSGLGGGPGAARFPPRLSKLLISPHLAAVAGPRREAGDIVHRNVFQGRRPAAATASCAANNARTSRTPRPCHRPPRAAQGRDVDGFRGRVGVMAHMAQPPWHSHPGIAPPVAPAHGMPPKAGYPHHPIPLHIGVLGMGCWGQGCQCGTGTLPWPQLAAGSRPGTACRPAQQCCPAEHRASFPSQFWERGAQRGNSSLGHMVLAGLSLAGGAAGGWLLCAEQGLPGSRAHQSPRPPPARRDHTGHGSARPPRGRRAACAAVMGWTGYSQHPRTGSTQPRTPACRAGRQARTLQVRLGPHQ